MTKTLSDLDEIRETFGLSKTELAALFGRQAASIAEWTKRGIPSDRRVEWIRCRRIGQRAHDDGIPGIASRSNAEATPSSFVGEELAVFDSWPLPPIAEVGLGFSEWYPDPIPG